MKPFTDSSDIRSDGPALAARIAQDGYLFVPGLLPRDAVAQVRREFLDLAAVGGWLARGEPVAAGIANLERACKDPEPKYIEAFRPMWALESLHRLKHHPNIVGLLERLFGEPVLVHPLLVARNIFPQTGTFDFTTSSHQDRIHIGGGTSYAVWVPLGDCPREKGSLLIAAGSHVQGVRDFTIAGGAGGLETVEDFADQWVGSDFAIGDAVIFVDTVAHKALPNRTRELRQSFDARYQRLADPIADVSVRTYGDMMTWDEVYTGWARDDLKYYWRAQGARVVPYDRQYYDKRDAIAFDLAERGDRLARDTLLRIVQRDPDATKRDRASRLLVALDKAS
ncbi:MAG: phytanoyl-CoA dioxygenase family protein [Proteobacteria bacterium]|nr:phytanoyl-CoA dioxygenase family protein [Pseudomonadota bacterium]